MAAAIGHACNIPFILRRLASNFYRNAPASLPVTFDLDFLLALDAGCDTDDIARPVASYRLEWWTQDGSLLLSFETLDTCLEHFQALTGLPDVMPLPFKKPAYTWSRHLSTRSDGGLPACTKCNLYRSVALGALDDMQDLRHLAHGLEVTADSQLRTAKRDAGAFFQLYEAAMLKAIQEEDIPGEVTSMPNSNWTSGPTLTRSEVLNLFRPPPEVRPRAHSGYNVSLSPGPRHDDSSIALSPGMGINVFDIPDFLHHRVPSLELDEIPNHFNFPPLRHFPEDAPVPTAGISVFAVSAPLHPPLPAGNTSAPLHGEQAVLSAGHSGTHRNLDTEEADPNVAFSDVGSDSDNNENPDTEDADPMVAFSDLGSPPRNDENRDAEEADPNVAFSDFGSHSGNGENTDAEDANPNVAFLDVGSHSDNVENPDAEDADPNVAFSDLGSHSDNNENPDAEDADPMVAFSDFGSPVRNDEDSDPEDPDPILAFSDFGSPTNLDDDEADPVAAFTDISSPIPSAIEPDTHSTDGDSSCE
jgi:hypothetical protein